MSTGSIGRNLFTSQSRGIGGRLGSRGLGEYRDPEREVRRFHLRLAAAGALVLIAFGVLFGRFIYLQVIQHSYYHTKAEDNRISVVPLPPNRGLIMDRTGVVLARNHSAYTLEIQPDQVDDLDATIDALAGVVDIQSRDRKRFKKLREDMRGAESLPIKTRLSDEEVARFAANAYRFPGVAIKARLYREYPFGELASHVLGYIGRINDRDLQWLESRDLSANYKGTDFMGKTGVEQFYEQELHGSTGSAHVEIDAGGRSVRTLSSHAPTAGNSLVLTLDLKLQEVAEKAFGSYRGALVAIDPSTGGILAFVSRPGYDPNLFVDGIDPQSWERLVKDPDKPLSNRALNGAYPPGSTFKPFMALMALELGKRTPEYAISDPGYFSLPGQTHRYRDWKVGGHGMVNLRRSIVISCDTYYYGLASDTDIDKLNEFLSQFGFGERSGIDVRGEHKGLLPSRAWKKKRFGERWYAGDSVSVGIGQGYNLTTPLQLAQATAILANNGVVYRPHLVREVVDTVTGERRAIEPEPIRKISLHPKWVQLVKSAMVDVTRPGGTAARAGAGAEYTFAGKTGTAQVIAMKQDEKYDEKKVSERFRDHALFISFAPAEAPRIALAVLVENGGHGSATAAPIARVVLDYFLLDKKPEQPPVLDPDAPEEG
ncbi:MAG: penicillin-binding protein 2 [Betaproteobacteria bacterium]|jgi:penicillin-binding protein 2|nr:penicillin-binding protein 2 [Betaproteobacteria bacterium]